MGLSEEHIAREFEEVFSYYEFDNHQYDLKEHPYYWNTDEWPKIWKLQRKRRQQKLRLKKLEKNQNLFS